MSDAIERDVHTVLLLDGEVVDSPLASIEYAVSKTGDATRHVALGQLALAATSHHDPAARARIAASMDRIRAIPNPVRTPIPSRSPASQPLRITSMMPGKRYRIVQTFETFDGDTVTEGTVLTFQGYHYFPHDGGFTVRFAECTLRLAEVSATNCRVLANDGEEYFAPADG